MKKLWPLAIIAILLTWIIIPHLCYRLYSLPIHILITEASTGIPVPEAKVSWRRTNHRSYLWWLIEMGVTDSTGALDVNQVLPQTTFFGLGKYNIPFEKIHIESYTHEDLVISTADYFNEVPLSSDGVDINIQLRKRTRVKPEATFAVGLCVPGSDWVVPIYETQQEATNVAMYAVRRLKEYGIEASVVSPSPSLTQKGYEPCLETLTQRHIDVWVDPNGNPQGVHFVGPNAMNKGVSTGQLWITGFDGKIIFIGPANKNKL